MEFSLSYALALFIEFAVAKTYTNRLLQPTRSSKVISWAFIIGYGLLYLIHVLWLSPFANLVSFAVINILLIFTCFKIGPCKAIIQSMLLTTANVLTDITALAAFIGISNIADGNFNSFYTEPTLSFSVSLISKLLYVIVIYICYIYSKYTCSENDFEYSNFLKDPLGLFSPIFLLPFFSIVIALWLCYFGMSNTLTMELKKFIQIIILILWILNILFLILYTKTLKLRQEQAEMQMALIREKAQSTYYEKVMAQAENQSILRHDMKNHLIALANLAAKNNSIDILAYINAMQKQMNRATAERFSDNDILNCILVLKKQECDSNNINFSCDVRSGCLLNMGDADIVALFSNLLSNAIEAAEKSDKRYIDLTVRNHENAGVSIITISNACDTPPITDGKNKFISSKKQDNKKHGFGLISIHRVVQNYNGISTMNYDDTNNEFRTIIQIPYSK